MNEQRAAAPGPSEIAGRYEVVQKLGAGAFGTVYKAKDKILGRMVAIKTIRLEGLAAAGSSIDELLDRFKREARVSAQLKHPNIVTIYDVGDAGGVSYLAMEFIDGVGLDRVIALAGQMPLERAASIGAQVADALDFAHKSNVVHRDIKPANIMVEEGDRVKVTDFGIAKVTDSGEHLTMTGHLLGTPSYMSPEQARGAPLDGRSDLFAVGCILYEMIAGNKAFRGESITGLIFKIITEEPPPLRELEPGVPDEMVRIITKALAKAPDARYQTGREMAEDLLALVRPGTTPTIRQMEVLTAPGSMPAVAPPATLNVSIMTAGHTPGAPPPTMAVNTASPPAMAGTVASARPPMPPVPPRAPAASAPPAPAPAARAAAVPRPTAPRAAPVPAPSSSRAGLLIGLAAAGLFVLLLAGIGGWMVLSRRTTETASTGSLSGASGTGATAAPASAPSPEAAAPPAEAGTPATEAASDPATAPPAQATDAEPPRSTGAGASAAGGAATGANARRVPDPTSAAGPTAGTQAADAPTTRVAPPEPARGSGFGVLDEEPAGDGRQVGTELGEGYRNRSAGEARGPFGTNRRFRARERSPRDLALVERPAVATLRYVMDRQELLHRKEGRYGSLTEMARGTGFALDVPMQATTFQRRGYRFDLIVEEDGFKITAVPNVPGARPFVGDDSGFIRSGLE